MRSGNFRYKRIDSSIYTHGHEHWAAAKWADVLDIHSSLVIEDAEAGPIMAKIFRK